MIEMATTTRYDGGKSVAKDGETYAELVMLEVYSMAAMRFGRRADSMVLITGAVAAARELLAKRPAVTDYVAELAIALSVSRHTNRACAA
jgi:hypothetical protein